MTHCELDDHGDADLAALADMDLASLRARWSMLDAGPVPKVSAALLRLALAWQLQAARDHGAASRSGQRLQVLAGVTKADLPAPGSKLVREWNGVLHTVTIGEDNAIRWNGRTWRSLSEVARTITGTRWSGPAFFGLRGTTRHRSAA